ncbi:glycosyltransferase [Chryseobacterium hagamense]|uniref:Glycosyl transferase n=1 Tax=Chryseobacterium hagamense TaxID=395935 RepID=A0A511YNM7_9FLAO|nr:glycosyltransferase [Chryseobacterium hagamense]GEN76795.1 glycosyl transferase [Chryseobacterium hagamense]
MKILLIQHLNFLNGSGGTEKICTFLANGFDRFGHEVEIATCQDIEGRPVFPLNAGIKVTNIFSENIPQTRLKPLFNYKGSNPLEWIKYKIRKKAAKKANKEILKKIGGAEGLFKHNLRIRAAAWREYIELQQPDIIITMSVSSVLEITFENEYRIPIINSVNGRPDYDYSDILGYRSPFEMDALKSAYKSLAGIQILFESYRDFLPETFRGKINVISNPVPQFNDNEIVKHEHLKQTYKIINVATLANHCKQQHMAIEAFAAISEKYPAWELHFWGEGKDFNFLNNTIKKLHLQDKIFLNGFTDDPVSKLKESDIFIFPSKYEGFGLALAEGMSLGLPALGFAACSGVNELIKHNVSGFLANDVEELTRYLEQLMEDPNLRSKMGKNGHSEMIGFNPEKILNQWNLFLGECRRLC